ncbi:Penicillin acylase 2 proenzyme [Pseudoalteromonas holothuriae]|uniref:Penicillin acylase 2 proenzyme n=1 Tax=Pseudoalteromonas holothuriae TaxID=2963714 RepID=A0ABM9GN47_9GAMM|nr:penicillin acylase family protein [Pseudoalteromonas sp. CIP111951]CAH9067952.1 Penicillin acylase 2 proenzyme [Pseudoalteromonas sp. CIP111951]
MKRQTKIGIAMLMVFFPLTAAANNSAAPKVPLIESTVLKAEQLSAPAKIQIDKFGIAHITASSDSDVYFAQGFNIARERLWQIDLWRRKGLGLLSQAFGPAFIEQDKASRLFLFRGNIKHERWQYGFEAATALESFVTGINYYIDQIDAGTVALPVEFSLLEYQPAKWHADDILKIRSHGLSRNVNSEVTRAKMVRDFSLELDALRVKLEPEHSTAVPDGVSYDSLPDDVLKLYTLATSGVRFSSQQIQAASTSLPAGQAVKALLQQVEDEALTASAQRQLGSNNWAISPSNTSTGRAILASDPHRVNSVPSGRYAVHLKSDTMNVIGAGEPYIPGVSLGHNGHIAFGFTVFSADQEDLYFYDLNPNDKNTYQYRHYWQNIETITEAIPVKGQQDELVTLEFTQHGPVIYRDDANNALYAIRAAWLEPGMVPYLASLEYQKARNWWQYRRALGAFKNPSENHVFADIQGNIALKTAGYVPYRANWDGLLPVPGNGKYEWTWRIPIEFLPFEYNPKKGWVASANEMNFSSSLPFHIGYEWAGDYRFRRIEEVLDNSNEHGIDDSLALQADTYSIPATELIAAIPLASISNSIAQQLLIDLQLWDKDLTASSTQAHFFSVWWHRYLRPSMLSMLVPIEAFAYLADLSSFGDQAELLDMVKNAFNSEAVLSKAQMTNLVTQTLLACAADAENLTSQWGQSHAARLVHPVTPLLPAPLQSYFNPWQNLSRGGSMDTVNANWHAYNLTGNFSTVAGTTWRMVIDVGEWDNSKVMNAPGQSGNPSSPFYQNLANEWAADGSIPLYYSSSLIDENTVQEIQLRP